MVEAELITQEQENEFDRIVECVRTQGDIDCLTNLISNEDKIRFIKDWNEGGE